MKFYLINESPPNGIPVLKHDFDNLREGVSSREMVIGENGAGCWPMSFSLRKGGRLQHIMGTDMISFFLVSQRFVQALRDSGCTGWSLSTIDATGIDPENRMGYCALHISGSCGPIDRKLSTDTGELSVYSGRKLVRGFFPDMSQWTGEDLFMPIDTLYLCCTDRVREAVIDLSGDEVQFVPFDEWIGQLY